MTSNRARLRCTRITCVVLIDQPAAVKAFSISDQSLPNDMPCSMGFPINSGDHGTNVTRRASAVTTSAQECKAPLSRSNPSADFQAFLPYGGSNAMLENGAISFHIELNSNVYHKSQNIFVRWRFLVKLLFSLNQMSEKFEEVVSPPRTKTNLDILH